MLQNLTTERWWWLQARDLRFSLKRGLASPCPTEPCAFALGSFWDFFLAEMKTNTTPKQNLLSPQQDALLSRLLPVARIATSVRREDLPVQLKTNSIIAGPSGNGKNFLASVLAERVGVPFIVINVSSWVVLSARNEPWTFSSICQWLDSLQDCGGILVLDEICALDNTTDPWIGHVRQEVQQLLDAIIPLAARMPGLPPEDDWETTSDAPSEWVQRETLARRLRDRVFILACGAWQHAWRSNSRQIGYGSGPSALEPPSREQILTAIEPELRQRFRNEIGWLPPMTMDDYLSVSARIANRISDQRIRTAWNRLAGPAIDEAVAAGLGMRVFEELMLAALLDSQVPEHAGSDCSHLLEM